MADEMKVLREKVNEAYRLLLQQGEDNAAEALVEAMTRAERATRPTQEAVAWSTPNDWGSEPLTTAVPSVVAAWRADNRSVTELFDRPAPPAPPVDASLTTDLEFYMEGKANVSEECADFLDRLVRENVSQLNRAARPAWEYSFIHSSATGRGDEKIGPCLTYDRQQAYGVGCLDQRPVTVYGQPATAAG